MEIAFGSNYIEIREELDAFGHQYVKTCRFTTDPKIMVTLEWKGNEFLGDTKKKTGYSYSDGHFIPLGQFLLTMTRYQNHLHKMR